VIVSAGKNNITLARIPVPRFVGQDVKNPKSFSNENYKVVITGSNASMLSRELETKFTGRHIKRML
jgi:hypothetical protein